VESRSSTLPWSEGEFPEYQLYRLRELGFKVRCLEDGAGVYRTWYWNRYPGCRFDSESETYGYS